LGPEKGLAVAKGEGRKRGVPKKEMSARKKGNRQSSRINKRIGEFEGGRRLIRLRGSICLEGGNSEKEEERKRELAEECQGGEQCRFFSKVRNRYRSRREEIGHRGNAERGEKKIHCPKQELSMTDLQDRLSRAAEAKEGGRPLKKTPARGAYSTIQEKAMQTRKNLPATSNKKETAVYRK